MKKTAMVILVLLGYVPFGSAEDKQLGIKAKIASPSELVEKTIYPEWRAQFLLESKNWYRQGMAQLKVHLPKSSDEPMPMVATNEKPEELDK